MSDERYPRVGQVVTVIAVRNLQAAVLGATVQECRDNRYTLRVEEADRLTAAPVTVAGRVKLLYGSGPMVWRLAGSIHDVSAEAGVLTVDCPDPPRPGERREFIRAEMVLTVFARHLTETDPGEALAAIAAFTLPDEDPRWKVQLVDLSGSGIRVRMDEDGQPDQLVEVRLRLGSTPRRDLALLGRIVRTSPAEGGGFEVALRFEALTETEQDALINQAFRVRYEQLGA